MATSVVPDVMRVQGWFGIDDIRDMGMMHG
jgi:hypothetical protein